jgi:hypothetical protein
MTRSRQASEWRSVRVKSTSDERRSATSSHNLREVFRTERRRRKTSSDLISPWSDNIRPIDAQKISIYTPVRHNHEERDIRFEPVRNSKRQSSTSLSRGLLIKLFVLLNLMMLGLIVGALILR